MYCVGCAKKASFVCSKCKREYYCSVVCQRKDWNLKHANVCKNISGMQIVWRDDPTIGALDVEKLWKITEGRPVISVPTAHLDFLLDAPIWMCGEGLENVPESDNEVTPRQVLANPTLCPDHWRRIQKADTTYPLLVLWPEDSPVPVDVLDGFHRLAQSFLTHRPTINVIAVSRTDMDHARILNLSFD